MDLQDLLNISLWHSYMLWVVFLFLKLATHVQTLFFQSVLLLYTPLICSPNPTQIPLTQAEMISDPLLLSLWGDNAQQLCSSISEDIHHANKRWSEQKAMFVKCLFAYSLLLFSIFFSRLKLSPDDCWVKTPTEMQVQIKHWNRGVEVILWNCESFCFIYLVHLFSSRKL